MILTCPKCGTRFELPAELLAPEGKKVKCTSCEEKWFQVPDPKELAGGEEMPEEEEEQVQAPEKTDKTADDDFESLMQATQKEETAIPEGVRPQTDAEGEDFAGPLKRKKADFVGVVVVALMVWLVLCGVFILTQNKVAKNWPFSQRVYHMLGREVAVPGEGLVFDGVVAKTVHDLVEGRILKISGNIINLESDVSYVPAIEASLADADNNVLARWHIIPPRNYLEGEGILPFSARYSHEQEAAEAKKVYIRFLMKGMESSSFFSKTAVEGGANTPVPPPDDPAHRSDHAESLESPPHDGARSDQESQ